MARMRPLGTRATITVERRTDSTSVSFSTTAVMTSITS